MQGKSIAIWMAAIIVLAGIFIWVHVGNNHKLVGKYLDEHKCSRVGDSGIDTIYECEGRSLSDSDIVKIMSK